MGFTFGLEPEAAVKYFEGLGYYIPPDWNVKRNEAQTKARTITGIHRQDIVDEFHAAMYEVAKSDKLFEDWRGEVQGCLRAHDWHLLKDSGIVDGDTGEALGRGIAKRRMETISRIQVQSAYMAGHWQVSEEDRDDVPWLQYSTTLNSRTCQSHTAAYNVVYRIDDPFWGYFYPPNGFNCRCTVWAFSDSDLKWRNLLSQEAQPEDIEVVVNRKGDTHPAEAVRLPDGRRSYTDADFQHNVDKSHLASSGQLQVQRAVELLPRLASVSTQTALKQSDSMRAVSQQAAQMMRRVDVEKVAHGKTLYVGALALPLLEALATRKIYSQSIMIAISDEWVLHILRDKRVKPPPVSF